MGQHYVPQEYLRSFQDPTRANFIWLFDKTGGPPHQASISKVAQSREFYDDDVEATLAHAVEAPANAVMDRLCSDTMIDDGERFRLSLYVGTMLMRVPHRRQEAYKLVPEVLERTVTDVREQILAFSKESNIDPDVILRRLAELDAARDKFSRETPSNVVAQIRSPWPSERMLSAIERMTWRVLVSSGPIYFMTSDNPAFFFGAYGLARKDAEVSFPLSTTHALHCCWQPAPSKLVFLKASQLFVKEVNRRIASAATRLGFYHRRTDWVQGLLQKTNPFLSRIEWP